MQFELFQTVETAINHNLNCSSNFAKMHYDPSCARCGAIRWVVFLRRKTQRNGVTAGEESAAHQLAERLRGKYSMTTVEIIDRQYDYRQRSDKRRSKASKRN